MEKLFGASWRPKVLGVVAVVGPALTAYLNGQPVDAKMLASGLSVALLAFFTRDNKVSSERAGAK